MFPAATLIQPTTSWAEARVFTRLLLQGSRKSIWVMVFLILVATAAFLILTDREERLIAIYVGVGIFAAKVAFVFIVSLFIGERP